MCTKIPEKSLITNLRTVTSNIMDSKSKVFVLLSGILAYSRLNEKVHTKSQVYIGLLIGLLTELIVVLRY